MTTYDAIKALPGKGYDWAGLISTLREMQTSPIHPDQEKRIAEKGTRAARSAAMELATNIVWDFGLRSTRIPASPETESWGGFLGGETVVYHDRDAEAEATARIVAILDGYRIAK